MSEDTVARPPRQQREARDNDDQGEAQTADDLLLGVGIIFSTRGAFIAMINVYPHLRMPVV